MRFSLFTPTHNPKHLNRVYASLRAQTFPDFEWIIVPNGGVTPKDIDDLGLFGDCRIRVIPYYGKTQNIGEIKKFACNRCSGEILVEVDHDDELTPDCLAELDKSFADESVDFAYSNCCEVENGKAHVYGEEFGWKYRPFKWDGAHLLEAVAFDPDPASFSKIWFAPNHVRAWRKEFYDRIDGHDASLEVCDDHDLLCRTYVSGKVKHLDKCLYVYHHTGENTCKGDKNSLIQEMTLAIHDKYIYGLVEKWCDLNGLRKIDLCGGFNKPDGYESIDLANGDITCDLEKAWNLEDGSVGLVRAHDALEHMPDKIHTMREIYRVLAPKGWLLSMTPSADSMGGRGAFMDPTHKSYWVSSSFWYHCKRDYAKYINAPVQFQLNRIEDLFPSEFHKFHKISYVKAHLYKFDPDGRSPGLVEI